MADTTMTFLVTSTADVFDGRDDVTNTEIDADITTGTSLVITFTFESSALPIDVYIDQVPAGTLTSSPALYTITNGATGLPTAVYFCTDDGESASSLRTTEDSSASTTESASGGTVKPNLVPQRAKGITIKPKSVSPPP